jgi:hypothetical protein
MFTIKNTFWSTYFPSLSYIFPIFLAVLVLVQKFILFVFQSIGLKKIKENRWIMMIERELLICFNPLTKSLILVFYSMREI